MDYLSISILVSELLLLLLVLRRVNLWRILVAQVSREALVASRDRHLCVQGQVWIIVHARLILVLFFFY